MFDLLVRLWIGWAGAESALRPEKAASRGRGRAGVTVIDSLGDVGD